MARERLSMRKIKEVLRLKSLGLTSREIAKSVSVARSTIAEYLRRAAEAGIVWPLPDGLDDAALERLLFKFKQTPAAGGPIPDLRYIHTELKKPGVTLSLLWEEYLADNPDGYRYTQFCHHYRQFRGKLNLCMRQVHRAGEKMFVDFAGQTVPVVDSRTGEIRDSQIFIAALGASNYTFAHAVWSQELENWVACHTRAFEFFGGAADIFRRASPGGLQAYDRFLSRGAAVIRVLKNQPVPPTIAKIICVSKFLPRALDQALEREKPVFLSPLGIVRVHLIKELGITPPSISNSWR